MGHIRPKADGVPFGEGEGLLPHLNFRRAGKERNVLLRADQVGLSREEYESLSEPEREQAYRRVEERFRGAGAQFVLRNLSQLPALIQALGVQHMGG